MNRRSFLRLLGLSAAALAADPEALLWRPGAKTIFLPSIVPAPALVFDPRAFKFVTTEMMTRESLRLLENNLKLAKAIDRRWDPPSSYDDGRISIRLLKPYDIT